MPRPSCRNFLLALAFFSGLSVIGQNTHARVKVHIHAIPGGMGRLAELGLAVDHGQVKHGRWFVGDLSSSEMAILDAHGHPYEVLIPDVRSHYVLQNLAPVPRSGDGPRDLCQPPTLPPVPQNFTLGSMGGFYTWQEMLDILDAMHAGFPNLISAKEPIGESWEGRPIHMVRISNAPDQDQDKPELFYNALHHAREPASLSQLVLFMWYLLENYGTDPEVTYIVDTFELYFVPCINPDGYVYNELTSPEGGGMWRKNRRNNGDGSFGVDLNRNYGFGWGTDDSGSSPNPASDVYRGPTAFSEPETQVIRDFCESREFRLTLNYHTFGNLLIYPWGYQADTYTPDSAVFVNYGQLLTRDNEFAFGTANQTVGYLVNGGSDDWMYGEQTTKPAILAMTPEAGEPSDGFWPAIDRITDICLVNLTANLNTAHLAGVHGLAMDRSSNILPIEGGYLVFDLLRSGQEPGELTISLELLDGAGTAAAPITFSAMDLLEERRDSIAYILSPSVQDGDAVRLVLAVNNGAFTYRDTLDKVVGQPNVLLADDGSTLNNWDGFWGLSNTTWFSPSSSITDSPFGPYPNNASNTLTLEEEVDLTDATSATLTFMAKWEIEPGYDYVQVLASGNGGISWTPLCGTYTKSGTEFQAQDEPLFDGVQPGWVQEEMDLGEFLGGPVRIRFQLTSDGFVTADGFYFDDLRIQATGNVSTNIGDAEDHGARMRLAPNPAWEHTVVHHGYVRVDEQAHLQVFDALGGLVLTWPVAAGARSTLLPTAGLTPGAYVCTLRTPGAAHAPVRLVVARP